MDTENVPPSGPIPNEEVWKAILLGTDPRYARLRSILKHIPSEPRCKMCAAPFRGIGRPFMRAMGRNRWPKNEKYCGACFDAMTVNHGGAEIESSFLFADVRGSTTMAEAISPTEFRRRLTRFYDTASHVMVEHDAIVDKFVGDEVVALFIPALAQGAHAARAIEAAIALLKATGHGSQQGPWIPVGIGVHTGIAFVGTVGEAPATELTALGDVVNTAARLASAAAAGEVLVTGAAAQAAALDTERLERRHLELKGKRDATDVFVATVTSGT